MIFKGIVEIKKLWALFQCAILCVLRTFKNVTYGFEIRSDDTSRARNRSWFRVTIYLSSDLGYAA